MSVGAYLLGKVLESFIFSPEQRALSVSNTWAKESILCKDRDLSWHIPKLHVYSGKQKPCLPDKIYHDTFPELMFRIQQRWSQTCGPTFSHPQSLSSTYSNRVLPKGLVNFGNLWKGLSLEIGEMIHSFRDLKGATTTVTSNTKPQVTMISVPISPTNCMTHTATAFYMTVLNAQTAFKVFPSLHPTFIYIFTQIRNRFISSEKERREVFGFTSLGRWIRAKEKDQKSKRILMRLNVNRVKEVRRQKAGDREIRQASELRGEQLRTSCSAPQLETRDSLELRRLVSANPNQQIINDRGRLLESSHIRKNAWFLSERKGKSNNIRTLVILDSSWTLLTSNLGLPVYPTMLTAWIANLSWKNFLMRFAQETVTLVTYFSEQTQMKSGSQAEKRT